MIEIQALTKRFGDTVAVDDMSCTVSPGHVTGFLGPNGAGKSTTMRAVMGLEVPTSGRALVLGRAYRGLPAPMTAVGALLDARAVDGARTAAAHLWALAATHGLGRRRVRQVLELAGLEAVARRRIGTFSLGMTQRLGIAAALLGDPAVLILDEPVNGLDPEGVLWVRALVRGLAAEGRTVLLSSHLMSEMAQTADHLIVLGRGRVLADAPLQHVLSGTSGSVRVQTSQAQRLEELLTRRDGVTAEFTGPGALEVRGLTAEEVGRVAAADQIPLAGLSTQQTSLEEAYFALTQDHVDYQTGSTR